MDGNSSGITVVPFDPVPNNGSNSTGNGSSGATTMGPLLYQYVYITLFNALIFIVGVSGNILVIQVVVRIRSMRKRMNFFLVSLSAADLQLLISGLPVGVLEFYSKERWYMGETMCRLLPFLENAPHHCSVLTLLVIGFERYYAICHPLKETARSRITSPSLLIPTTWVISCVVALPMAFTRKLQHARFYDGTEVDICRVDAELQFLRAYILFIFIVFFLLPLLLLTAMYTTIILTLENSTRNHSGISSSPGATTTTASNANTTNGSQGSITIDRRRVRNKDTNDQHNARMISSRRQVIRMMVAVMVFYFLCLVPMRSYQMWTLFTPPEDIDSLGLEGFINLAHVVRMLIFVNCAGNPIIYGLISANFRNAFKQSMTCGEPNRMEGHRYNFVYYNTTQRRSGNAVDANGAHSVTQAPCRRHCANTMKHVTGGGDNGGNRQHNDSKKICKADLNGHKLVDDDKTEVMSTEVVMDLYDKVYSNRNGSNGNNKEMRTFV